MKTKTPSRPSADTYFDLVQEYPLRPIRNKRDYSAAAAMTDRLAVRGEADLDAGEADYLETLSLLVEAYDDRHHPVDLSHLKPLDVLKNLMEQHGMRPADLGRLLGGSGLASEILSGKRELSKSHIRKLAGHFGVEAGLFL